MSDTQPNFLRLRTDLTRRDLIWARTVLFFRPCLAFFVAVGFAVVLPLTTSAYLLNDGPLGIAVFVAYVIICFAIYIVVLLVFSALEIILSHAPTRGILGQHDLQVTSEGLVEETSFNRTLHPWSSIDRVLRRAGLTLIRAGAGWHIIPHRYIDTSAEARKFVDTISARVKSIEP